MSGLRTRRKTSVDGVWCAKGQKLADEVGEVEAEGSGRVLEAPI
jgi:hypothetical protein